MAYMVKTIKVNEEPVEIYVNGKTGEFFGEFDDREFREDSLPKLEKKIREAGRRARTLKPIPVSIVGFVLATEQQRRSVFGDGPYVDGYGVVDAFLRGRNDRTRQWLMLSETREKFSLGRYNASGPIIARRLTSAEKDEYTLLALALDSATNALEAFKAKVKVDPHKLLADKGITED